MFSYYTFVLTYENSIANLKSRTQQIFKRSIITKFVCILYKMDISTRPYAKSSFHTKSLAQNKEIRRLFMGYPLNLK